MFDESIKFKYSWRPYQERTLKYVEQYIRDKKIHIVAAPGSGKTVLGLELARFLGMPVIIFAPTVTIKNQWIDRFISLFTDFKETPNWISSDIYNLKFFNVVTYQALHYAYKKSKFKIEEALDTDDIIENEIEQISSTDIKNYDIVEELKKQNITTIILDEAHHLKSQWWDSLKKVLEELKDTTILSLTATPPYDSEYSEWKKYISLCGEIDAEITVPELVKANNLCPHQDYIYFSYPTKEEQLEINKYENLLKDFINTIKENENFANAIKAHKFINSPYDYQEELLDNIEYYSSMLIFLNSKNIRFNRDNLSILGNVKKIPNFTIEWLEILLKNVLITDRESFIDFEETITDIEKQLHRIGVIEKSNISFSDNETLQKYFLNSIGKLNSISEILKIEQSSLKEDLRMVILTDYIRKEYLEDQNMEIKKLGVIPIFRKLSNDFPNTNMAILTGSLFAIPLSKKEQLCALCTEEGIDINKINFEPMLINPNYAIIKLPENIRNKVMSQISKLFSDGEINVIIGTKSLLGEGWDEPSINTLILASFVGSFMLSNQMRGRAIRVNSNPNKTANIWHLVCVNNNISEETLSNADFTMLTRRFNSFVGIDYDNTSISSGISRLGNPQEPFTLENINYLNNIMKTKSSNRTAMFNSWKKILEVSNITTKQMTNKVETSQNFKMKRTWFINKSTIRLLIIFLIIIFLTIFKFINLPEVPKAMLTVVGIFLFFKLLKIYFSSKSINVLRNIGYITLNSLYKCGFIKTHKQRIKLHIKKGKKGKLSCYLTGTTLQESNIFVDSIEEIFSKTINQRYIISKLNYNLKEIKDYYNVPTVLSSKKEYAEIFSKYWEQNIGKHHLIYTRTADGRKMLLKARMKNISLKDKISKKQELSSFR